MSWELGYDKELFGKNLAWKFTYAFRKRRDFSVFERKRNIYLAVMTHNTLTEADKWKKG